MIWHHEHLNVATVSSCKPARSLDSGDKACARKAIRGAPMCLFGNELRAAALVQRERL